MPNCQSRVNTTSRYFNKSGYENTVVSFPYSSSMLWCHLFIFPIGFSPIIMELIEGTGSHTSCLYSLTGIFMRRTWKWITLLGGTVLMLVALTMIAATTLQAPTYSQDSHAGDGSHGVLREYRAPELAVRFYYPRSWVPQETSSGVMVEPTATASDFIEQGALFAILRGSDDTDTPPLPPLLQSLMANSNGGRASDNVAVGGMIGTETVVEWDVVSTTTSPANSQLASAMRAANSTRLTLIVWETEQEDTPMWVIMADARAGEHLETLQEIRNSIRWE